LFHLIGLFDSITSLAHDSRKSSWLVGKSEEFAVLANVTIIPNSSHLTIGMEQSFLTIGKFGQFLNYSGGTVAVTI
jgi:hypothetical protein